MWFVLLLLALNWPVGLSNDPDLPYNSAKLSIPNRELCWERCFQVEDEDTERFREIYDDFYKMGMEARRLKNMYGVNGTAILLDSTLSTANLVDINNGNGPPDMRFAVPNYNVRHLHYNFKNFAKTIKTFNLEKAEKKLIFLKVGVQ